MAAGSARSVVDELLEGFAQRHDRFLSSVSQSSLRLLSDENARLCKENERLMRVLAEQSQVMPQKPPPIPAVPDCLPRLREAADIEAFDLFHEARGHRTASPASAWAPLPAKEVTADAPTLPGTVLDEFVAEVPLKKMDKKASGDASKLASDSALARLNVKFKNRQKRRIRDMLKLDPKVLHVSAETLYHRVKVRDPTSSLTARDMQCIIDEFVRVHSSQQGFVGPPLTSSISFDVLVDCLLLSDILEKVDSKMFNRVQMFQNTMMTATVGEVIEDATRGAVERESLVEHMGERWESILNSIVVAGVLLSIICMGTSIDFLVGHWMWIVIEALCCSIFMLEICLKIYKWGFRGYFCGYSWKWNVLDLNVTCLSLAELILSVVEYVERLNGLDGSQTTVGTARISLILRALRFTRILRLVKLLHSPILRELANMLVGCVIGMPALLWVLILFLIILFMTGLGFRIVLGPGQDQNEIARCGYGDDYLYTSGDDCKLQWMYGEEFFSSVKLSMFTAFRFMIGDYSTRKGYSLAVVFSQAYGDRFHLAFCTGMIMVMFGLFNIITAIFVDTVVTGLKHNDVKRKYARQYERKYVQQKLQELLSKVADCVEEKRALKSGIDLRRSSRKSGLFGMGAEVTSIENRVLDDLTLTEDDFMEVMDDPHVQCVLVDLDCDIPDPSAVFDTFDPDDSGEVTAAELVQAVLKLRGEPAKNDMVAAWVALRQLHEKLDSVQMMLVEARHRGSDRGSEYGDQ